MNNEIEREFQKLVMARLRALPDDTSLSMGNGKSYKKEELVGHVENNDDIGQQMVEIDKMYLQAIKDGSLFAR
jgi:hypothetical protein